MNTFIWLTAGAVIGWIAFKALHVNLARGLMLSIIIGAMSAYFGGSVLAPLFSTSGVVEPDTFAPFALVMASATAVAFLYLSEMVYERFGV